MMARPSVESTHTFMKYLSEHIHGLSGADGLCEGGGKKQRLCRVGKRATGQRLGARTPTDHVHGSLSLVSLESTLDENTFTTCTREFAKACLEASNNHILSGRRGDSHQRLSASDEKASSPSAT